jgi:xanthine dehydrogenase accessory factor
VTESQGSTPGKPGMKMVVRADGSIAGTIGGGQVEKDVIAEIMGKRFSALTKRRYQMGGDFGGKPGMTCGGEQEVIIEPYGAAAPLYIVGAGHCAMELSGLASRCGFAVTVIDDRPEWASREKHPGASTAVCQAYSNLEGQIAFSKEAFIVIMTHQHLHDEEALRACLGKEWRYLGLIGSRRKAGLLFDKLAGEGIDRGLLGRVHSPIGLDIGSETPAEIAVSIAAQLIGVRNGPKGRPPERGG